MRLTSLGYRKVKAVQCYVTLLVWLILVSLGSYWYLFSRDRNGHGRYQLGKISYPESTESEENLGNRPLQSRLSNLKTEDLKEDPVERICNPVQSIAAKDENVQHPELKLEGIIVIFRHGDRGPLNHIGHRNISHINCEAKSPQFEQFTKFANDTILKVTGYAQFIGTFHSFAKLPSSPFCSLGQLTQLGSSQLLGLGKLLRSIYRSTLTSPEDASEGFQPLKVVAYSTRYRRTFQSLMAFLYGFLGPRHMVQGTTLLESQSITFCFKHCSCKATDRLKKEASKKFKYTEAAKQRMAEVVNEINFILGTEKTKKTGNSLLDSLLVYACHGMELPCYKDNVTETNGINTFLSKLRSYLMLESLPTPEPERCIIHDQLISLIHLINNEATGLKNLVETKSYHMLNSYGMLKEMVNIGLRMTSMPSFAWRKQQTPPFVHSLGPNNNNNFFTGSNVNSNMFFRVPVERQAKVVVFSGHDVTLQSLTAALGINSNHSDLNLPPFGSRMIFEFYSRTSTENESRKLYFRLIFNGSDITHLITFCKDWQKMDSGDKKVTFCPFENLVRFIQNTYFDIFDNASSFKDACRKSF